MPKSPITTLSGLKIVPSSTNPNTGLYVPALTTTQIAAIPASTKVNGGLFYNTDINTFQCVQNGVVYDIYATADSSSFDPKYGQGLNTYSEPFRLPLGQKALVEADTINNSLGFIYIDNTTPNAYKVRVFLSQGWSTLQSIVED